MNGCVKWMLSSSDWWDSQLSTSYHYRAERKRYFEFKVLSFARMRTDKLLEKKIIGKKRTIRKFSKRRDDYWSGCSYRKFLFVMDVVWIMLRTLSCNRSSIKYSVSSFGKFFLKKYHFLHKKGKFWLRKRFPEKKISFFLRNGLAKDDESSSLQKNMSFLLYKKKEDFFQFPSFKIEKNVVTRKSNSTNERRMIKETKW